MVRKVARPLHEATAHGSSGFIWAAIRKLPNANIRIEPSTIRTRRLRERDLSRDLEGPKITPNEYIDRWLETAVKPRVREKTWQDYEGCVERSAEPRRKIVDGACKCWLQMLDSGQKDVVQAPPQTVCTSSDALEIPSFPFSRTGALR